MIRKTLCLGTVFLLLSVIGCSPKEIELSGKIIPTEPNFGVVPVKKYDLMLFSEEQVKSHLAARKKAFEDLKASQKRDLDAAIAEREPFAQEYKKASEELQGIITQTERANRINELTNELERLLYLKSIYAPRPTGGSIAEIREQIAKQNADEQKLRNDIAEYRRRAVVSPGEYSLKKLKAAELDKKITELNIKVDAAQNVVDSTVDDKFYFENIPKPLVQTTEYYKSDYKLPIPKSGRHALLCIAEGENLIHRWFFWVILPKGDGTGFFMDLDQNNAFRANTFSSVLEWDAKGRPKW